MMRGSALTAAAARVEKERRTRKVESSSSDVLSSSATKEREKGEMNAWLSGQRECLCETVMSCR